MICIIMFTDKRLIAYDLWRSCENTTDSFFLVINSAYVFYFYKANNLAIFSYQK